MIGLKSSWFTFEMSSSIGKRAMGLVYLNKMALIKASKNTETFSIEASCNLCKADLLLNHQVHPIHKGHSDPRPLSAEQVCWLSFTPKPWKYLYSCKLMHGADSFSRTKSFISSLSPHSSLGHRVKGRQASKKVSFLVSAYCCVPASWAPDFLPSSVATGGRKGQKKRTSI